LGGKKGTTRAISRMDVLQSLVRTEQRRTFGKDYQRDGYRKRKQRRVTDLRGEAFQYIKDERTGNRKGIGGTIRTWDPKHGTPYWWTP